MIKLATKVGKKLACLILGHVWGEPLARTGRLEERQCLRCHLMAFRTAKGFKPW